MHCRIDPKQESKMFDVEVTYPTKMGNLRVSFTTSETVASREEAEELRIALRAIPELANAAIKIKNTKPRPTVDEAIERFIADMRKFPVMDGEDIGERQAAARFERGEG
jgi:hypothetical protein